MPDLTKPFLSKDYIDNKNGIRKFIRTSALFQLRVIQILTELSN